MIDINRIQHAQMVGVFTVFRLIGRRAFARSTSRSTSSSEQRGYWSTDRSIYRCQTVSSRDGVLDDDDDDDVPIKLARGVYGDRLINRDPKSSAIRSAIVYATNLHAVPLCRLIHVWMSDLQENIRESISNEACYTKVYIILLLQFEI